MQGAVGDKSHKKNGGLMNHRIALVSALSAAAGLSSPVDLYAQQLSAPPAKISVTRPSKPYHVTEITASEATCDSPDTYSFFVSWKPVFKTWGLAPGAGPYIWKHYSAGTKSKCTMSVVMCGDAVCTVKASACTVKAAYSLVRIQTFFDDLEKSGSSPMQIGGIPRPTLTWADSRWQCSK